MTTGIVTAVSRSPDRTAAKASSSTFEPDLIGQLRETEEFRIETQRSPDGAAHRVTIWVVTLGRTLFVRSVLGRKGRWYREVVASGRATIQVGRKRIAVRPVREKDPAVIARVSAAYRRKYGHYSESDAMVRPSVAGTTLRLLPA